MTLVKSLKVGFLFLFLWSYTEVIAQNDSIVDQIYAVLILDSLTITADTQLPDVKSMIRQTINDTTFYQAFQRLRRKNYRFSSEVYFYKADWIPYTYMRSLRDQVINDGMRTNKIIEEDIERNLVDRKGNFKFFTVRMYEKIFFTNYPVPVPEALSRSVNIEEHPDSRIDKYTNDLKLLLFAPGTAIDIPLMGNKTAIFTEEEMKLYKYSISMDTSSLGIPAYNFIISAHPDYPNHATVIKELKTLFDQQNNQVLGRNYSLKYNTVLYSFDVNMNIDITVHDGNYVPTEINYKGQWNIPFKQPELCNFSFKIVKFH